MKLNAILLAFPLLAAAGASHAATTAELKVIGTIVAPACDIDLTAGGQADFGDITRDVLSSTTSVALGSRSIDANVTCTALTAVAIKFVDNKPTEKPAGSMNVKFENIEAATASLATDNIFGLGMDNSKAIGGYAIRVGKISVTNGGSTIEQPNVGSSATGLPSSWTNRSTKYDVLHSAPYVTAGMNTSITYANGTAFKFPLDVAASLDKSSNISGLADIPLAGSATLEVVYL
ncbi:DUF1120 domain-containing protein [Stenotrophomonas rhizophila]|uniref:DUF1120 domain-containing protein n=1 Tax=Stenotrophomonas rhizophila TaxID=216778 RepID=UPI001E4847C9|nr:DUF1120 domain-containing protein [Stenotrophomonas rhizophila]MCC7636131.1 DUF1120 domain-containing protein [Stenotrophomonas rhizophila]